LAAAFSPIWWSQATGNEVYGLNLFFVALVFLLLFQLLKRNRLRRNFLLLAYVLGLSFTNHLQTVLLFPTFFLLYFFHRREWNFDFRTWILAGLLFFLGLSTYLYLPIRSTAGPLADWGATSDWGNFLRHIFGWQYRVYIFDIPFNQMVENGFAALGTVATQLKWPLWILIAGLFFVRLPNRKVLFPLLFYPVIILIYNAGYAIPDIDFYYLPVIFCLFILAGVGAFGWFSSFSKLKQGKGKVEAAFLIFLSASTAYAALSNWGRADQSKNRFAQEVMENIYASAPDGGLVFTAQWDHYSPWLYNHFVLGKRPDLKMLNVNLTNRSWYLDFLQRTLPEQTSGLKEKIGAYRAMVRDFETGRSIDTARIEGLRQTILASILRRAHASGPVYFDAGVNFDSAAGWFMAPEGALFRVYEKPGYYPYSMPPLGFSRTEYYGLPEERIIRREIEGLNWILNLRKNYEEIFGPKSPAGDTRNRP